MTSSPELDKVRRARRELESAQEGLLSALRAAYEAGATQREIARAAGISQAQVWKLLHGYESRRIQASFSARTITLSGDIRIQGLTTHVVYAQMHLAADTAAALEAGSATVSRQEGSEPMNYGEAVLDPSTKLGAMAAQTKQDRKQALAALMAQGMTLEQAATVWATAQVSS